MQVGFESKHASFHPAEATIARKAIPHRRFSAILCQDLTRVPKQGHIREEDLERLSPLVGHHINYVGEYHFSLPEEVKRRELRPFHDPTDPANII